jgi:hypothetical protein
MSIVIDPMVPDDRVWVIPGEIPVIDMSPLTSAFKRIGEKAAETAAAVQRFIDSLPPIPPEVRCDYSWLWESQCAHCLGHVADWEEPRRKPKVYGE